jgi:hypothetical protein
MRGKTMTLLGWFLLMLGSFCLPCGVILSPPLTGSQVRLLALARSGERDEK